MGYILKETTIEEIEKIHYEQQRKTREMIRHELKTQNGRMTEAPMYCVMETIYYSCITNDDRDLRDLVFIREIFFTNKEAEQYAEENKSEHDADLFIYVKSGYRNEGWKYARELMLKEGDL